LARYGMLSVEHQGDPSNEQFRVRVAIRSFIRALPEDWRRLLNEAKGEKIQ